MDKELLEKSQAEYLRQLNEYLMSSKKPKITENELEKLIDMYIEKKVKETLQQSGDKKID